MVDRTPGLPEPPPAGRPMLPPGTFDGQVVMVTGGGTGLGKAMATEFARLGARIVIASRSADHHAKGIAAVEAAGGEAMAVAVDVRQPEAIAAAFDAAEARFGPVDVLVNNAAGNFPVAAENLSPNGWRAVTDIVLDGTFFCSPYAAYLTGHDLVLDGAERLRRGIRMPEFVPIREWAPRRPGTA